MDKFFHTNQRFQWHQLDGYSYLELNLSKSSLEEKIAAFYHIGYFMNQQESKSMTTHLLVKYDKEGETQRLLNHLGHFLIHQQFFQKVAFYGNAGELLLAAIKIANNQGKDLVRLFESKKSALGYFFDSN